MWAIKVEDKEAPSSYQLITEDVLQPANSGSTKGLTTLEGHTVGAGMGKATLASSEQEFTPAQTKSETAVVELTHAGPVWTRPPQGSLRH